MFSQSVAVMAAGVLFCAPDGYRVVVAASPSRVLIAAVVPARGSRHRGDVPLPDEDRHAIGLMPGAWLIRVDGARIEPSRPVMPVGNLPPKLLERVTTAAHRSQVARAIEDRAVVRMDA